MFKKFKIKLFIIFCIIGGIFINYSSYDVNAENFLGEDNISEKLYNKNENIDINNSVESFIFYIVGFLYILTVIYGMYGGFRILTATHDEEKVKKGKTIIIQSVIGLIVIFLSSNIVNIIIDIYNETYK